MRVVKPNSEIDRVSVGCDRQKSGAHVEISDDELERLGISVLRPLQTPEQAAPVGNAPPQDDLAPMLAMLASESAARSAAAAQAVEVLLKEALAALSKAQTRPDGPEAVRVTVRRDERGRIVGFDLAPQGGPSA